MEDKLSSIGKIKRALTIAKLAGVGCELSQFDVIELAGFIADLEQENARLCEVEKELTKEKKLSDDLYLLLVDNPSTKKLADKIIRTANRRKE